MDTRPPLLGYLSYSPRELAFGTSGLRGLVRDMTDLEVYINVRGYLDYLLESGGLSPGEPIAIARDLRERDPESGLSSSPRIAAAVARGIRDAGPRPFRVVNCGQVPTPALACHALSRRLVGIVVTGSHIPADRNGVKFYRRDGEVLKSDEAGILAAVARVRAREYEKGPAQTPFDPQGMFRPATEGSVAPASPDDTDPPDPAAEREYVGRYLSLFPDQRPLRGERLVCYQHSAVGRDLLVRILEGLGATVIPVERSERFVPVDTEEVTAHDEAHYRELCALHHGTALVSTDGDGDRPLVVDERGAFHRGDALGILVAEFLGARLCAVPISTTDALDRWAEERAAAGAPVVIRHTPIGSPHVIRAMNEAIAAGATEVVSWEANGGFLLGTDFTVNGRRLPALPTRDAVLPIVAVLLMKRARGVPLSALFAALPARATQAGLIDHFPLERSRAILAQLLPEDRAITLAEFPPPGDAVARGADGRPVPAEAKALLLRRDRACDLLGLPAADVARINYLDGVRVYLRGGDVIHLRPSGNAPQMRIYAVADRRERADELVRQGIAALQQ